MFCRTLHIYGTGGGAYESQQKLFGGFGVGVGRFYRNPSVCGTARLCTGIAGEHGTLHRFAAAVVVSAAAAVVSAVELDPHPVNAEAATTAAIASAVTFFIISISPQIFSFL